MVSIDPAEGAAVDHVTESISRFFKWEGPATMVYGTGVKKCEIPFQRQEWPPVFNRTFEAPDSALATIILSSMVVVTVAEYQCCEASLPTPSAPTPRLKTSPPIPK